MGIAGFHGKKLVKSHGACSVRRGPRVSRGEGSGVACPRARSCARVAIITNAPLQAVLPPGCIGARRHIGATDDRSRHVGAIRRRPARDQLSK